MSLSTPSPDSVQEPDALFTRDGEQYLPTSHSRGYWVNGTLNGAAVASLLAHVLEQRYGEPGLIPVRYMVDLLGMPRAEPISVTSRLVRGGGRLRLVEAEIVQNGALVTRASLQLLRETEAPVNPTWQSPPWPAAHPDSIAPISWGKAWEMRPLPPEAAFRQRQAPAQVDPAKSNAAVLGELSPITSRQGWMQVRRRVVADVEHTPFSRLAMAADFASPFSHSSEAGIDYVNTDFTIYAHRQPVGEWLGFETVGHGSRAGIGIGECWVHDVTGPVGTINLSTLAQIRKR